MRHRQTQSRAGYFLTVALLASAILSFVAVALAQQAAAHLSRERSADGEALAEVIILSARDWSRVNANRLIAAEDIELPIDALLPSGASGIVRLSCNTSADQVTVECRVTLRRPRANLTRQVMWPLPAARQSKPESGSTP